MKRQSFDDPGHAHYLTFSCYRRQQLLTDDHTRTLLAQAINNARRQHHFRLWAWVIMPEHAHLLLHPITQDYSVSEIMRSIKGPFARRIITNWRRESPDRLGRLTVISGGRVSYRFWQAGGGFDRNMYQTKRVEEAIEYIEYNPVRRRLVSEASDWR